MQNSLVVILSGMLNLPPLILTTPLGVEQIFSDRCANYET